MIYECKAHHVSLEGGTCYADGCFRKLFPQPEASEIAQIIADGERQATLDLDRYVLEARGHGERWWLQ